MSVEEMFAQGELERVEPDEDTAALAFEEARLHVQSAGAIAATDRNGAYQLAYDAARKAVTAHMRRVGARVRRGEGAHVLTAKYAQYTLDVELGDRLESIRRRRNRSEYGTALISAGEVREAIAVAAALIDAAAD
jgi:hypothetical protein